MQQHGVRIKECPVQRSVQGDERYTHFDMPGLQHLCPQVAALLTWVKYGEEK